MAAVAGLVKDLAPVVAVAMPGVAIVVEAVGVAAVAKAAAAADVLVVVV